MKYSIIIPVWNTEKYLNKCFDSILNQTYKNYEVIIINDGSIDNSEEVIKKYCNEDERFTYYNQKHAGPADARNLAVSKVTGDYILFLDSDDYWESSLLEKISQYDHELIKYGCRLIDENDNLIKIYKTVSFNDKDDIDALKIIVEDDLIDSFCIYAFKKDFFINNRFLCQSGRLHEDFGTIAYILLKATDIISIDYIGLNYVKRKGSITNDHSIEMETKKAIDTIEQYSVLINLVKKESKNIEKSNIIITLITDSVIRKYSNLQGKLKKRYKKLIIKNKIYQNLSSNTLKRFIKKYSLMFSIDLYLILTNVSRKKCKNAKS